MDGDVVGFEDAAVDAVEPQDLLIFVLDQPFPVERRRADIPAIGGRVLEITGKMRAIGKQLLRNTAHIDTGAAKIAFFRDAAPRPVSRAHPGAAHAARSRTNHIEIEIILRH